MILFLHSYFNEEIVNNTKAHFYTDDFQWLCIENDFAKYFAKCGNLFKYFVSRHIITFRNDTFPYYKTNQISLLHDLTKCFSDTRVNQISFCCFRLRKKWCLRNLYSIKNWMVKEIVDKNVFSIMALPNNLALVCRF